MKKTIFALLMLASTAQAYDLACPGVAITPVPTYNLVGINKLLIQRQVKTTLIENGASDAVFAVESGTVYAANARVVTIHHNGWYSHYYNIAPSVVIGMYVNRGEQIGAAHIWQFQVATTGNAYDTLVYPVAKGSVFGRIIEPSIVDAYADLLVCK